MLSSVQLICDPMDCSPPVSPVHGISQARILEWVVISYLRGSSQPRDPNHISCISCIGRQILYCCATWEAPIRHSWKVNPSRDAGICNQLFLSQGAGVGMQRQQPGKGSYVFRTTTTPAPDCLPASWRCQRGSPSFFSSPMASPLPLVLLLWGWPLFANSHGKF